MGLNEFNYLSELSDLGLQGLRRIKRNAYTDSPEAMMREDFIQIKSEFNNGYITVKNFVLRNNIFKFLGEQLSPLD